MYLGAQRVRSVAGAEGVNVFGYRHSGAVYPIDWSAPNVAYVADRAPGRLMFAITQVSAPGNAVLSYLDVVLMDGVPAQTVARMLGAAMTEWPHEAPLPVTWSYGNMALRFYVTPSRRARTAQELCELKDELVLAVAVAVTKEQNQPTLPIRPPGPLRILRRHGDAGYRYALDAPSREYLRQTLGGGISPDSIGVTHENADAFAAFVGRDLESEIAQSLTRMPLERLDAFGGAVIIDEQTGDRVWSSPGRGA